MAQQNSADKDSSGPDNALQAISNGLVQLMAKSYGRGPTKAKTFILGDGYVVCVMHDVFTTAELTLIEAGEKDLVRQTRVAYQTALAEDFKTVVSDALAGAFQSVLTGRATPEKALKQAQAQATAGE